MLAGDAGDVHDVSSSDDNSKEQTIHKAILVKSIQSCAIQVLPFTVCWVLQGYSYCTCMTHFVCHAIFMHHHSSLNYLPDGCLVTKPIII